MNKYKYDLHIHSCLSPCADDDMTPANIAGMASVQGLNIAALTDHNSTKNCPAFFYHAKKYGIIPVAGMELTTAEDIHVICLFKTLEAAMDFGQEIEKKLIKVKNKIPIFGHQYIMDNKDEITGEEEALLINATTLDLLSAYSMCGKYQGVCYPAHIDRQSNGIISILGGFPEFPKYTSYELNMSGSLENYKKEYPVINTMNYVVSSDAHSLWKISDGSNYLTLDDEPYSGALVREKLIEYLAGL